MSRDAAGAGAGVGASTPPTPPTVPHVDPELEAEVGSYAENVSELNAVRTALRALTDKLARLTDAGVVDKEALAAIKVERELLSERELHARNALKTLHQGRLKHSGGDNVVRVEIVEWGRVVADGEVT